MIPNTYSDIFKKLVQLSAKGKVDWRATSSENEFLVSFASFSLAIQRVRDNNDDSVGINFRVFNANGNEIDSFIVWQGEDGGGSAQNLFDVARRKAMKIDEAIDVMSKALDMAEKGEGDEDDGIPF